MKYFLIGIIMGLANVIPGVSGGTIAVSFNIFDRLIGVMSQFRTRIKSDWKFLACLGGGLAVGIVGFANLMVYLLNSHPVDTSFFFLGVILGSVPLIYHKGTTPKFNPKSLIPFFICLGIMIFMTYTSPEQNMGTELSGSFVTNFIMMMLYGAIGAFCMIIPGISGSFVLMFIGAYGKVMGIIADFNIPLGIALGIGILFGGIGCAKIINKIIYQYGDYTYMGILGFVIGSLLPVYPGYSFSENGIMPFVVLAVGFAVTFYFNLMDRKNEAAAKAAEEKNKRNLR